MANKKDGEESGKSGKALSWKDRFDADKAGRRWDDDVRKGMGKWEKGN